MWLLGTVMNLHPRTTGHPRNSLCTEHAVSSARTRVYCHVVPHFVLMEKPGAWQGNAFIFLTHMRLGRLWNWKLEVVAVYWISKADQEIGER